MGQDRVMKAVEEVKPGLDGNSAPGKEEAGSPETFPCESPIRQRETRRLPEDSSSSSLKPSEK